MATRTYQSRIDAPPGKVFDWHARPGAFERLTPPWAPVRLESSEGVSDGAQAVLRIGPGPLAVRWVAEHQEVIQGEQFVDRQVTGPFRSWKHLHRMESLDGDATRLIDHLEYEPPFGEIGHLLNDFFGGPELDRQFSYRHRITQQDLSLHRQMNPGERTLRIAVSGTSGLIGSALCAFLTTGGHDVYRMVRSRPVQAEEIYWNAEEGEIEADKLEGLDAVIHLAGESVFGLWTQRKKERIYESRAKGTRMIAEAIAGCTAPPSVFISASGISYYGEQGSTRVTDDIISKGGGFLPAVVRAWEGAADAARSAGVRTVHPRIGVVLTPAGGALKVMTPAFWMGLGGRVGSPDQYFPWITLDDVIGGIYHMLFESSLEGPVNLCSPEPARMQDFAKTLARVMRRPAMVSVPSGVVRRVAGEMGEAMLLTSIRAIPEKLTASGYDFLYGDLESGLRHQLGRTLEPFRPGE